VWVLEDKEGVRKMSSLFSKEERKIYVRRITGFWDEFKRKKIGLVGLTLIIFFVSMALLAPWLTPYDPILQPRLAQSFARPEWITIFPGNENLPRTREVSVNWKADRGQEFVQGWGNFVNISYQATGMQTVVVGLSYKFTYDNDPPNQFVIEFSWTVTQVNDVEYSFTLSILTPPTAEAPEGNLYQLVMQPALKKAKGERVYLSSINDALAASLGLNAEDVAPTIFSQMGEYKILFEMRFKPKSVTATAEARIADTKIVILGSVWGFLGTDYLGADVFTALVYGARISLLIGLLAAIAGTSIGIVVGIVSGYVGGIADEISMRIVDILLCIPMLPLLLAFLFLFGKNIFYIVLFIAIFGWQGLARLIRSQVLSIRETAFIECARASGGSRFYIMYKHILPNILPVAFASLVLAVPGAILSEAALSFLGFGDPRVATWGKMLQYAHGFGGFTQLAWWWILPPGIAITATCLAFVFIGHAFDEIVNPRLRRRR
jgi:peptide/nickel transport system permease protein